MQMATYGQVCVWNPSHVRRVAARIRDISSSYGDEGFSDRSGDGVARRGPGKGCRLAFEEWVVAHARISKKPHRGATIEDTLSFFHQLATLVSSGTPLLQALKIATAQCESLKLQRILAQITAKVEAGSTFHSAAAAFPQVFEFQWLEAIRTGEVTGKMSQVLIELNKQIRDSRETKRKVKGALTYPMILIFVAVTAVT